MLLALACRQPKKAKVTISQWRGCKNRKQQRHRGRGAQKNRSATEGESVIFDFLNTSREIRTVAAEA